MPKNIGEQLHGFFCTDFTKILLRAEKQPAKMYDALAKY